MKRKPLDLEEEEENEEEDISINGIIIGDMQIQSKKPIKNPAKVISSLLKNNTIKNYLKIYDKQKIISRSPSYID